MLDMTRPEPVRSPLLGARAGGVRHGFFTRRGGVSTGIFDSLNIGLGSTDSPEAVRENRRRVAAAMGVPAERLVTIHQCHSAEVVTVEDPFPIDSRPNADGLVTRKPGVALGVLAADCGPVLFADTQAGVIGAAHAGWKGALTGILENTIDAMERLGARREHIAAVLGPSISQENYEVGPEYIQRFIGADEDNARYFRDSGKSGHALFDLNLYTIDRLTRAGIKAEALGRCTYAQEDDFFSYRRAAHRGEPDYGRQISAICLEVS